MNRKQWFVLGVCFILIGLLWSRNSGEYCSDISRSSYEDLLGKQFARGDISEEQFSKKLDDSYNRVSEPLTYSDVKYAVRCVVDDEIWNPFISLAFCLGIFCFIMRGLEPKQKLEEKRKLKDLLFDILNAIGLWLVVFLIVVVIFLIVAFIVGGILKWINF